MRGATFILLLALAGCAELGAIADEFWGPVEPCARAEWAARNNDMDEWKRAYMLCFARGGTVR